MKNNIYITIAHPNLVTSTAKQSYIVDILISKDNAIKIADKEFRLRGNKFYCDVQEWSLDKMRSKEFLDGKNGRPSIDNKAKIVYSNKEQLCN